MALVPAPLQRDPSTVLLLKSMVLALPAQHPAPPPDGDHRDRLVRVEPDGGQIHEPVRTWVPFEELLPIVVVREREDFAGRDYLVRGFELKFILEEPFRLVRYHVTVNRGTDQRFRFVIGAKTRARTW